MIRKLAPGLALVALLGLVAWFATPYARRFVAIDATFLALLLGLAAGALARHPAPLEPGAQKGLKWTLLAGVVLLGAEVNLLFLVRAGAKGVALAAALMLLTMVAFWVLARALKLEGDTWALLGAGTGVCGLSAVVATGASLKSREEDVAIAVAAVGILSAAGLLLYPLLGALLGLTQTVYGAWSGLSVHAIANAIAAGFAWGDVSGQAATVTKLARVALLAPMLLVLTLVVRHKARAKGGAQTLLPPMVWGFFLLVLAATFLPIPEVVLSALARSGKLLLVVSMAALGYTTRAGHFRKAGPKGIALAVVGWAILSVAALFGAIWIYG